VSSTSPIATHELVYLNRAAMREAMPPVIEQIDPIDATYRAMARGRVEMPPKPGVHPRPDPSSTPCPPTFTTAMSRP
jgi:hypothetical protein